MKNKNFAFAVLVLNVICAWSAWWTLGNSIFNRISNFDWLIPVIAFSVWAVVFTLGAIFIQNRKYFYGAIGLGALGYPLLNSVNFSVAGVALAAIILMATEHGVKSELAKGVQINFYYVVRQSLKFFVTAVCLVAAFSYYFSLDRENAALGKIEKQSLADEVDWGLKAATYVVSEENKQTLNDVLSGVTLDEYLLKNNSNFDINAQELETFGQSVGNFGTNVAIQDVSESLNEKIREESLKKSKEEISKQLGIEVEGREPVKEIIVAYIHKTQNDFFKRSGAIMTHLPIIMALALFLTARILATIVDLFLGFAILLLIKLFGKFGIISFKKEMKEAAVIEYSV